MITTAITAITAVLGMPSVLCEAKLARPAGLVAVAWPLVSW